MTVPTLSCPIPLGEITPNVSALLLARRRELGGRPAFAQRESGSYRFRSWDELVGDVLGFLAALREKGLRKGDRCAFVTSNCYDRLVCELAVMAGGLVSVPIFAGYARDQIARLLSFSKPKALVIEGDTVPGGLPADALPGLVFGLEQTRGMRRASTAGLEQEALSLAASAVTMIMFTSGTSGVPKGVQLTHRNLMSQQRALEILWKPERGMRFLCYLPWHHSFGGLFERFFALHSGGCLAIDDSWGKNPDRLLENFAEIRPHVYFSVPKVYQEVLARILARPELGKSFFIPELKFVFTAAAPLPQSASAVFRSRGVPVVEGWGLTETSPCCTLTGLSVERAPGVVGFPLPGVEIRLGDESEILVRGPNVMLGYLDQPEATAEVLDAEGWFRTGDVGELTPGGLRLLTRKDRMFKLSNGEKVFPAVIEERLRATCGYLKHAYVFGKGQRQPLALLFPNREMFQVRSPATDACGFPGQEAALASCLGRCIRRINDQAAAPFERIERAVVVCAEPSIESGELTPSFKLIPRAIESRYGGAIRALEESRADDLPAGAFLVEAGERGKGEG